MTDYKNYILALVFVLIYTMFLLISIGWGFIIGAGLTWMGVLNSPTPSIVFFLVLNHIYLIAKVIVGYNRR